MTYTSVQELQALLIFRLIVLTEEGFMPWSLSTSRRRACRPWTSAEGLSGIRTANLRGRRKQLKSLPSDQNAEILRIRSDSTVEVRQSASEEMAWHQKVPAIWWYWTRVKAFLNLGKACLRFIGYQQFITWQFVDIYHVTIITPAPPKSLDFCKTNSDGCFICPWVDDWCLLNIV